MDNENNGQLKKDWKIKKLGEVLEKGTSNLSLKKIENDTGIYPIFGAKGFIKNISSFQQKKEALAIIKDGTVGRVFKLPPKSSILATMQFLIPTKNNNINFCKYLLETIDFQKDYKTGSVIPHIYYRDYKNREVPIPPLPEQQKITQILDKAFTAMDKIKTNLEKNIANTKELFQSKLQQIFSEQGKDWKVKKLGEVCNFMRGLTYKKSDEVDFSSNQVLRANNISLETGTLNFDEIKYIDDKIKIPNSKIVKKGSLLICTASGSKKHLGKVAFIDKNYSYAFGGFMGILNPMNKVDSKYLWYQTRSKRYLDFILNLTDGTNINNLRFNQLSEFAIPLPSLPEQKKIIIVLDTLSKKLQRLEANYKKKLLNLEELKKVFLDKAFKGKLV